MEVDRLRTFLALLEHASFTRAAGALRIGRSAASFHVRAPRKRPAAACSTGAAAASGPTAAGGVLRRYALRILAPAVSIETR